MKFTKRQRKALAYASAHRGCSYRDISNSVKADQSTLFRWRKDIPGFSDALEAARGGTLKTEQTPVDVETFVNECLGLGIRGIDPNGKVWPGVMPELNEICSGKYDLVLLAGSLGSAKTYCAVLAMLFELYKLMMLDDPHQHYGLDPASPILFAVQNRNRKLAERNDYQLLRNLIEKSPWFQLNAPFHERLKSRIKFVGKNVEVWPSGANAEELMGMNLHSLVIDEANFYAHVERSKRAIDGRAFDGAREAFESALRRKQTRFPDGSGLFLVSSSRRYHGQFTDQLQKEFADDPRTYTFTHTPWSIQPEAYADSKWFSVFVGDRQRPPRILGDDEETHPADRDNVIQVPERFKRRFKSDIVRSLQDIAGVSTAITGGFFTDVEAVAAASWLPNRFVIKADVIGNAAVLLPVPNTFDVPCPQSGRHVHVDLSLTGDLTGIACGHVMRYGDDGLPKIHVDGLARVHPPKPPGQINLNSILELIQGWLALGIPIKSVSFDGFQSADLLQRVGRLGVRTGRLSVDMTSPNDPMAAYETLRLAISENRFSFPDDPETCSDLLALQVDHQKQRIDHLPGGKKDVADCLAAMAFHLTHNVRPWGMVGQIEGAEYAAMAGSQLGGRVTGIPAPRLSHMDLIRVRRGIGYSG